MSGIKAICMRLSCTGAGFMIRLRGENPVWLMSKRLPNTGSLSRNLWKRTMHNYICYRCGDSFQSKQKKRKYCGSACYNAACRKVKTCKKCGKPFRKGHKPHTQFCSDKCARGENAWTEENISRLSRLWISDLSTEEIALRLGRSKISTQVRASILRLPRRVKAIGGKCTLKNCMTCGRQFSSSGPGNRMCDLCRSRS